MSNRKVGEKMKRIVIATHGTLAKGFQHTLEIIGVNMEHIQVLNFYCEELCGEAQVSECFAHIKEEDQLIVCTDIQFGSVNQMFMREAMKHPQINAAILSGINLPLLLELASTQEVLCKESLQAMVEKAAKQLTLMDLKQLNITTEDDIF